ncbi:unnamed protein product [Rotaria sp. Silwood2]|nr:unnamed protein product [Rotaria sp. Silwood2]
MLTRIVKCDLHAVRDMQSLNETHQLIRKLTRPIGEIAALLQENIHLAEQHKNKVLTKANDITPNRIPQKVAEVVLLEYPRTICTSKKFSKVVKVNDEMKVDYIVQCHRHCYLQGVEQEVINNPILKHCRAIDKITAQLKQEQEIIRHICAKLTLFLRANSINPTNEDIIEYINHFIREEKEKQNAGDNNEQIIIGLQNLIKEYQDEINLFKSNVDNQANT